MITLDAESAAACIYALPRGKEKNEQTGKWEQKIVKGPTARFAEVIAATYRNNRYRSRTVSEDEQFITAEGLFLDLENNVAVSCEVRRRITDREGRRYNSDMVAVTANAAQSIALRNAVLKGIPKAIWKGLYLAAEQVIVGDRKTLADRRQATFDQFKAFSMTPPMVCSLLGVSGLAEVDGDHLVTLQGILTALRDGDTTVEQLLANTGSAEVAAKGKERLEEVKSKYREPAIAAAAQIAQQRLKQKRAAAVMPAPAENPDAEPVKEEGEQQSGEEGW
jgi:hypothetical protein